MTINPGQNHEGLINGINIIKTAKKRTYRSFDRTNRMVSLLNNVWTRSKPLLGILCPFLTNLIIYHQGGQPEPPPAYCFTHWDDTKNTCNINYKLHKTATSQ